MARKQSSREPSAVVFDVQSKAVLAPGGSFENMKEKIGAVRAIVPNRSNTEIVLVLQHFDNCVARTVQAFMEGNASEVLKEWTVTGRKKNKKKKSKAKAAAEGSRGSKQPGKCSQEGLGGAQEERVGLNGFHLNGCAQDTESMESLSEGLDALSIDARELEEGELPAVPAVPARAGPAPGRGSAGSDPPLHPPQSPPCRRPQPRGAPRPPPGPAPAPPPAAAPGPAARKLGCSIERSVKDLQRCAVSLARLRALLREEVEASLRRMKKAFAELQSSLMDREVTLLAEMDKVKAEAMEILGSRQKKAEALKKLTEGAGRMAEEQLVELRADIKHFVSERKYDEELSRVAKFSCELEGLKRSIAAFGQVSHPRSSYSNRSRCSPPAPPSAPPAASPPASTAASSSSSSSKKPSASLEASTQPEGSRRPAAAPRGQPQRPPGGRPRPGPGPSGGRRQSPPPATPPAEPPPPGTPPQPQPKALPPRRPRASRQEGASC